MAGEQPKKIAPLEEYCKGMKGVLVHFKIDSMATMDWINKKSRTN